ncbi:MAG: MoaD/ThiS family protein [Cyanobium sp. CZS 48M]|nr:MoaD/ThiS family protein [Cyanobacteriota bacterium]MDM7937071.1 MoaD/ThiS family protein [Cyanobium sp. CZS48M]
MIHVRLFAGLREQAGWGERSLAISAQSWPTTPASLWRQLGLGEAVPPQVRVAVNQAFAALDQPLQPGDEVAFLPPISGG